MDGLSATASITSLCKITGECSLKLYDFIQAAKNVDKALALLEEDAESLRNTLGQLSSVLDQPSVQEYESGQTWKHVSDCLAQCNDTINGLSEMTQNIQKSTVGGFKALTQAKRQFKLERRDNDIKTMQRRIRMRKGEIGLTLELIVVRVNTDIRNLCNIAPDTITNKLMPRFNQMDAVLSDVRSMLVNERSPLERSKTKKRLHEAKRLMDDDEKTVFSHTDATTCVDIDTPLEKSYELQGILLLGGDENTDLNHSNTLPPDAQKRIVSWIPDESQKPHSPLESLEICEQHAVSSESQSIPDTTSSGTVPLAVDDITSDGEGTRMRMAAYYLKHGRESHERGDLDRAERLLKKAIATIRLSAITIGSDSVAQVKLQLANICFQKGKDSEARELSHSIANEEQTEDEGRTCVLEASFLLSRIMLSAGELDEAERQCRQTLDAQFRLNANCEAYFSSVALMATICEEKKDEDALDFWLYELPDSFVRPHFRLPHSDSVDYGRVEEVAKTTVDAEVAEIHPAPLTAAELLDFHFSYQVKPFREDFDRVIKAEGQANPFNNEAMLEAPSDGSLSCQNLIDFTPCSDIATTGSTKAVVTRKPVQHSYSSNDVNHTTEQSTPEPEYLNTFNLQRTVTEPMPRTSSFASDRRETSLRSVSEQSLETAMKLTDPGVPLVDRRLSGSEIEEAVRLLVDYGMEPTHKNFDGREALALAAQKGDELVVRLLLEGWTVQSKKTAFRLTSKLVVEKKPVYVDTMDDKGFTPLQQAVINGNNAVAQTLVAAGASIHKRSSCPCLGKESCTSTLHGLSAIGLAVRRNREDLVKSFVSTDVDLELRDYTGQTALSFAASEGRRNICIILLEAGADVHIKTGAGNSLLHLAAANDGEGLIALLLERGIPVDIVDNEEDTPLQRAIINDSRGTATRLIRYSADVSHRNNHGQTPLMMAAREGRSHYINLLVQHGSDLEARNDAGATALHLAAFHNRKPFLKHLLSKGASVHATTDGGRNVTHNAASGNAAEVLEFLITEHGLDVNVSDEYGVTPLMLASSGAAVAAVRVLISHGSDRYVKCNAGLSALDRAKELSTDDAGDTIVKLLEQDCSDDADAPCSTAQESIEATTEMAVPVPERKQLTPTLPLFMPRFSLPRPSLRPLSSFLKSDASLSKGAT